MIDYTYSFIELRKNQEKTNEILVRIAQALERIGDTLDLIEEVGSDN